MGAEIDVADGFYWADVDGLYWCPNDSDMCNRRLRAAHR
jgi:hypothetical protein